MSIEGAVAPVLFVIMAVTARLAEHMVLEDIRDNMDQDPLRRPLTPAGKALVEALSAAGQVMVVAAGVTLGIMWS